MYVPIWYVGRMWEHVGGISTWDGPTKTWRMQHSSYPLPPGPKLLIDGGTSNGYIYIDGKLTGEHISVIVGVDPYSHRDTAYMPIYTIRQVFGAKHWNTTEWVETSDVNTRKNSNVAVEFDVEDV